MPTPLHALAHRQTLLQGRHSKLMKHGLMLLMYKFISFGSNKCTFLLLSTIRIYSNAHTITLEVFASSSLIQVEIKEIACILSQ
jgi:hypothetical protein